jgi:hypothetical protein
MEPCGKPKLLVMRKEMRNRGETNHPLQLIHRLFTASRKLKARMSAGPPNLRVGRRNDEPPIEMNLLTADGQPIPTRDPANIEANGQDREGLSRKREKARQFAPRHIQMMALGIFPRF